MVEGIASAERDDATSPATCDKKGEVVVSCKLYSGLLLKTNSWVNAITPDVQNRLYWFWKKIKDTHQIKRHESSSNRFSVQNFTK